MGLLMPTPVRNPKTSIFQLRVRVPADLVEIARGKVVGLPVGDAIRQVTIGDAVKVSLGTREPDQAKARHAAAYAALTSFWAALRSGPIALSQKQTFALAGEAYTAFVAAFDENPGPAERWEKVLQVNSAAKAGKLNPLAIPDQRQRLKDVEARFSGLVAGLIANKGLVIDDQSRRNVMMTVADALDRAATINLAKASGDYSGDGIAAVYPAFEKPGARPAPGGAASKISLSSIIDEQKRRLSLGKDAIGLNAKTEQKFRRHSASFTAFGKTGDASTITAKLVRDWMEDLLAKAQVSNRTVRDMLSSLRTVVQWGRTHHPDVFHPLANPVSGVTPPEALSRPSSELTYTIEEAKRVLTGARSSTNHNTRWLPWLCAYSGARVEEIAGLRREDFFKSGRDWFYHIRAKPSRSIKNSNSERRVPVHPALVDEGFIDFLDKAKLGVRLFTRSPSQDISRFVRGTIKIARNVPPSHGWRHLFEDLCTASGVSDDARAYITGRGTGTSRDRYGRSDAMLPGLAREMKKLKRLL
ncbi:MAG: hypothetical protein E5Y06_23365 [Mesorhizobium sp.]|uniref:DUF6538 domain-containing protein n=1 Tax=Mesorhizobium sp. TaxID=1871066 RepID=UPI001213DA0F|nr:DUF6538 domain-containing protein [Mesorhizobium sp.]TIN92453.1 MAG: hypothetical protein E5Y06_23365 [Mesorhizobium sp.]TJU97824.1 MAG: hypothetical protein E5Y08_15570 [Mesorhizobium sp.]